LGIKDGRLADFGRSEFNKTQDRKCSFSPSSEVNVAPHLGHLTSFGSTLISAQPREKVAKVPTDRSVAMIFSIPNISFGDVFDDIE